jgi:ornithine cyclodeaminase/alanine dehydrogenase-like protein (mu-crystallin family)
MSLWERWRAAVTRYDITLFKSTGIAVQNVIAAKLVYEAARMRGVGIAM